MLLILTEYSAIIDSREEIKTPAVARAYSHKEAIADKIPMLDRKVEILLLVGRDAPPLASPKTDPGWVLCSRIGLFWLHNQ